MKIRPVSGAWAPNSFKLNQKFSTKKKPNHRDMTDISV
jgi:hypothetical protein